MICKCECHPEIISVHSRSSMIVATSLASEEVERMNALRRGVETASRPASSSANSTQNPADDYWIKRYGDGSFASAATANSMRLRNERYGSHVDGGVPSHTGMWIYHDLWSDKHVRTISTGGAQAPQTPHPGTIAFVNLWNNTGEAESADNVPDAIKFFCMDSQENKVSREEATCCIPIVQIETFSVGEDGKPIAPKDADFISIKSYGPGHSFVESTVTPPLRKRPPTGPVLDLTPYCAGPRRCR